MQEEKKSFLKKKKYEFFLKLGSLNTVFLHFTVSKKDDAFELSKCFDSGYKQYEKDKTTILKANNVRLASSAVKDDLEKLEKYRRMARTIEEKSQNVVELKHYLDNFVYRKSMKFMAQKEDLAEFKYFLEYRSNEDFQKANQSVLQDLGLLNDAMRRKLNSQSINDNIKVIAEVLPNLFKKNGGIIPLIDAYMYVSRLLATNEINPRILLQEGTDLLHRRIHGCLQFSQV